MEIKKNFKKNFSNLTIFKLSLSFSAKVIGSHICMFCFEGIFPKKKKKKIKNQIFQGQLVLIMFYLIMNDLILFAEI